MGRLCKTVIFPPGPQGRGGGEAHCDAVIYVILAERQRVFAADCQKLVEQSCEQDNCSGNGSNGYFVHYGFILSKKREDGLNALPEEIYSSSRIRSNISLSSLTIRSHVIVIVAGSPLLDMLILILDCGVTL